MRWPIAVPPTGLSPHRSATRSAAWLALIVGVAVVHGLAMDQVADAQIGWGHSNQPPPRMQVTFVKELAQAAPPAALTRAVRRPSARLAERAAAVASAPLPEPVLAAQARPPEPEVAATPAASAELELAQAAPNAVESPPAPTAASAPEPAVTPPLATSTTSSTTATTTDTDFNWPPSTRLRFNLEGRYRGPINGSAQVDWLVTGLRYQVHLETSLGPVLSRHITSQGLLTPQGLAPQRFDGEQKVLFRATRHWGQRFTPERITLADGSDVAAPPGAQDEASQFVQLTWLFTTQPELLQVGKSVSLPLALNRRVDVWTFDVVGQETLYLPFGAVNTFHVKPRREAGSGVMTAEVWFAPSLQTLPVRILVRQDADSWIDLTLDKPPLQAER